MRADEDAQNKDSFRIAVEIVSNLEDQTLTTADLKDSRYCKVVERLAVL